MNAVKEIRKHYQRKAERGNLMSRIMPSVWGMETRPKTQQYVNRAHYNHYRDILYNKQLNDGEHIELEKLEDVSELVKELRDNKDLTIAEIEGKIRKRSWSWLGDTEEKTLDKVVELAVRLWLFAKPVLTDKTASLEDAVRQGLPTVVAPTASDLRYLKPDFSAESLIEIGGMTLVYTSYLDEHLSFAEKKHLRIFRHASVLYHYEGSSEGSLYPADLLEETARTIQLMWPEGPKSGKGRRKTCQKKGVDLEAQMADLDAFDLTNYPLWRHRLAAVQKALDEARPTTLAQWWYDRRDKPQWATFWVAVLVFVLTVVFGAISSVIGILQTSLNIDITVTAFAAAASNHLPTPEEHLEQAQKLGADSAAPKYDYQSDWSRSEVEDDTHSTSRTSDTAQLSAVDFDEWQLEPEGLFDQVYIAKSDLRRLDERRPKLIARQLRLRESRRTLQQQRHDITDQQARLLEDIRILVLSGGKRDLDHLFERLHTIQELQELLRTQAFEYDRIEKRLIDRGWRIRRLEDKLLNSHTLTTKQRQGTNSGQSPFHGSQQRTSLVSTTSSQGSGMNTILQQKSPLSPSLRDARTRLHNLELEHEKLLEEENLRRDLDMALDEDSGYALRIYSIKRTELLEYLKYYEGEPERLAAFDISFDKSFDQFPYDQFTGYDPEILAEQKAAGGESHLLSSMEDEILHHGVGESPPERLLLQETTSPVHGSRIFPQFANEADDSISPGLVFIGDWFLDMLRSSTFAVFQFKLRLDQATANLDTQSLQEFLLAFWHNDGTSEWYLNSLRRAAESLDPTLFSESIFTGLPLRSSGPNLLSLRKRWEGRGQSGSLFARRSEVTALSGKLKDLRLLDNQS